VLVFKKLLLGFVLISFCSLNSKVVLQQSQTKIIPKNQNIQNKKESQYNRFSKKYSKIVPTELLNKNYYIWQENDAKRFTELILSWNTFRPKNGKYSFYVSVKYNNRWSAWSKISEWSLRGQKTFLNSKNKFVQTKHVRVEMQQKLMADGFKIKVLAENGADIKNLKALFVSVCDMNKFVFDTNIYNKKSTIIKGVPKVSQWNVKHQRAKDFCSPTSMTMVLGYFYKKGLFKKFTNNLEGYVKAIAPRVHDDSYLDIYGAWPLNIAQAFNSSRGSLYCSVERLYGFDELYEYVNRKIPVAVSVRGHLRGGFKPYDNGHFVVVVGWDNKRKTILCVDPAFVTEKTMLRAYNLKDFMKAWGTSRNLAYIMLPRVFYK
jgi:hypothetical protein